MSREGPAIASSELDYIQETFCGDVRALYDRMVVRADEADIPRIAIDVDQARLLQVLLRATGARRVVDIGTLFGFSAAVMAQAMGPTGEVISIELEPKHAEVAHANLEAEGLAEGVTLMVGPAPEVLADLPTGQFDLVHIDADKVGYATYLKESLRLLRPGGIIAADNTLAFGLITQAIPDDHPERESVEAIRQFNRAIASDPRVASILVPMGDGLVLGVVSKEATE